MRTTLERMDDMAIEAERSPMPPFFCREIRISPTRTSTGTLGVDWAGMLMRRDIVGDTQPSAKKMYFADVSSVIFFI